MPHNENVNTLTVNQREKVSEDGKSASHFFVTIWSAGAVSRKASKLRCSALLFSDIPDSARSRSGSVLMPGKQSHSPNREIYFIIIHPI